MEEKQDHIVVLDGLVKEESEHESIRKDCLIWNSKNASQHKLVVIFSMASTRFVKTEDKVQLIIKECFAKSWKIDENYMLQSSQMNSLNQLRGFWILLSSLSHMKKEMRTSIPNIIFRGIYV